MKSIKEELLKYTGVEESDYDNNEELINAVMEEIYEKGSEDFEKNLSEEAKAWYNANADALTDGDDFIDFEVPKEETVVTNFDENGYEVSQDTACHEELKANRIDGDAIEIEDIEIGQMIGLNLSDKTNVFGEVIKKLKMGIKIKTEDDEEIRISNKNILQTYLLTEKEEEVEQDNAVEESCCTKVEALKECPEPEAKTIKGISTYIPDEQGGNAKQILHHISEVLRLISNQM